MAQLKPKIYFISGLGADERAFSFLDLSFCEPVFIGWLPPLKNESLHDYAMRMMVFIPEENPLIVGLSFGGMLAAEMALAKPKASVVLVSSNKTATEFPFYLRIGKYIPVYKLTPNNFLKSTPKLFMWMMSANGKKQKEVLLGMARDTDMVFAKWAINSILKWENKIIPKNVTHIHGNADTLLLLKNVKADYIINGGTHSMIMDKADEISDTLKAVLIKSNN